MLGKPGSELPSGSESRFVMAGLDPAIQGRRHCAGVRRFWMAGSVAGHDEENRSLQNLPGICFIMPSTNLSLQLPPHLLERLERLAEAESTSVDQLVVLAVAEKIARLEEAFYRVREGRSPPGAGWRALERMGTTALPLPGDELPAGDA